MYKILSKNPPRILTSHFNFVDNYDNDVDLVLHNEDDSFFGEIFENIIKINKIIEIGSRKRLDKIFQSIILNKYNIYHPQTYYNYKNYKPIYYKETFDSYCDLDEFVVKPILGARGIGVKVMNRKDYRKLLDNPKLCGEIYKNEIEHDNKHNDDISSEQYVSSCIKNEGLLVQEKIDVKREFRLICFPENELIYERVKTDGQFLGNLSHGSYADKIDIEVVNSYDKSLLIKIKTILKDFNYPWLSIDLFVDEKNRIGIFEFQMEFAYEGFNHIEIRENMANALKYFINKNE